ncbi:MAG: glutamate--tRNA ligase [Planctomycetes bacterium]|nr:glutamate--tRNA ligase [Planctomycetota bacterium]
MTAPRLRFAPSPTGPLHLGGARTAMYNWALARALGGAFVLRIEDTDCERSTDASLQIILEGLRWLGIDWDEGPELGDCGGGAHGPYFQMQRLGLYREAAERLLASGHAYRCYCTPERLAELREEQKANKSPFIGYDGRCRDLTAEQCAAHEAAGRQPNLRFRMPTDRVIQVHDLIRGDVEVNTRQLDDWVMVRIDGVPLYNFACVVDDIAMAITHVVRGEEHFLNGIKQLLVFEALGHEAPRYAHIPLILNAKGAKLSKRDPGVKSVLEYRDLGYPPEAVFNYIALLGWGFAADRDVFTRDEMVAAFKIENVGKAGARFDLEKLHWMCGEYVRRWTVEQCVERSRPWLEGVVPADVLAPGGAHQGWLRNIVACYQERVQILSEFGDKIGWLFADPTELDDGAQKKMQKHGELAPEWLRAFAELLAAGNAPPSWPADRSAADRAVRLPSPSGGQAQGDAPPPATDCPFDTPAAIEAQTRAFCDQRGIKFGHFVHPLRAVLTGTDRGPGLFDVVFLLGKETCIRRANK